MIFHLLLGLAASTLMAAGLVMMKGRAATLPEARRANFLAALLRWFTDPVWMGGVALQTLGYALYLAALAGTPVSILSVVMQGGVALFILGAVLFLGEHASGAEWFGIAIVVFAMIAVACSLGRDAATSRLNPTELALVTGAGVIGAALPGLGAGLRANGVALALASGCAFGLAALYAKALTSLFAADPSAPLWLRLAANPYLYLTVAANFGGMVMLQNAFHRARGLIAMPLSSALSNLVPIAGGMVAFGERLPDEPALAAMRVAAFVMTIAGGVLMARARPG